YLTSLLVIDRSERVSKTEELLVYGTNYQKLLLNSWINERSAEINSLALLLSGGGQIDEEHAEMLQQYNNIYNQLQALVLVDAEGYVVADTAHPDLLINDRSVQLSTRDYFIK